MRVVVPELGDRVRVEGAEHVGRERVELHLHQPPVARNESRGATVCVLARLRREGISLDLLGRQCDTSHLIPAIAQLKEGDQTDPFVLGLIASAYQKAGDAANARSYAERVMLRTVHTLNTAFARPAARALLKPRG